MDRAKLSLTDETIAVFCDGWKAGYTASSNLKHGKPFLGGFGFADYYATGIRDSAAWRGAFEGYMAGIPKRVVVCDGEGNFIKYED